MITLDCRSYVLVVQNDQKTEGGASAVRRRTLPCFTKRSPSGLNMTGSAWGGRRPSIFLGWIPCLQLAQANRSFPSTPTRLRLANTLDHFDLALDNGFGQHVQRLYEHVIHPLRAHQNCALTTAPADYPPNATPMQQVRIKYLRNHDWIVLPLQSVPKRRLKRSLAASASKKQCARSKLKANHFNADESGASGSRTVDLSGSQEWK